jgi:hypothetical protein
MSKRARELKGGKEAKLAAGRHVLDVSQLSAQCDASRPEDVFSVQSETSGSESDTIKDMEMKKESELSVRTI